MKTIKAEPITREAFAPFGTFYDMLNPDGYALEGEIHKFYPDRISESCPTRVGYSPIVVKKTEKMIIKASEYHTTTPEMILPLDDDMIIHVAPASGGAIVTDWAKAFIVPKGDIGEDQYGSLASCAASGTCKGTACADYPAGMYLCK